jgi:hypothetical protein
MREISNRGLEREMLKCGTMMTLARRFLTGCCLMFATLVYAHPGHDGHELTWDMRHLAQHPFATMGCAAVFAATVALAVDAVRRRGEMRGQRTKK